MEAEDPWDVPRSGAGIYCEVCPVPPPSSADCVYVCHVCDGEADWK